MPYACLGFIFSYYAIGRKTAKRQKSISGRGSLPGAGDGAAAAAAAAAAATAATAMAYTQISSKLEGIEGLISALKVCVRALSSYIFPCIGINPGSLFSTRYLCA